MAAMASCFDVVHLEDNLFVSCKDVKKQGNLRCYMNSAFLAMVEVFRALHSLWVTLFPFAVLWWNVMLYAMCAKYYSWNRSRHWLQTAGRRFCGTIMLESHAFAEVSIGEEREKRSSSPHQRGSRADASLSAENREMSILFLCQEGACAAAGYDVKGDAGSTSHTHRKLHHGLGVSVELCMLDRDGNAMPGCLEESCPCHFNQLKEQILCEATPHTSKLSSLCLLEEREPQALGPSKHCDWAACSFSFPHRLPTLAMLDVHCYPQNPLENSCLQFNLWRSGNMLHLKGPIGTDLVSNHLSMLREWVQTFNGSCVPAFNCGKKYLYFERKVLTSQTSNDDYARLQFILSITDSFNILNAISSHGAVDNENSWIGKQWSLLGRKIKRNFTHVDIEGSGLDNDEDIGSVCCNSINSDDECEGMYCTGIESTIERDGGLENPGVVYGKQCYGDDGDCCYDCCPGYEDSGIDVDTGDSFSAHCDSGYFGLHSVLDVNGISNCVVDGDDICSMDYDADDSEYINLNGNVEDSSAVLGHFQFAHGNGAYGNALEIRQILMAKSSTWWDDEDAVLVGKQESEDDSIEQEWQVI